MQAAAAAAEAPEAAAEAPEAPAPLSFLAQSPLAATPSMVHRHQGGSGLSRTASGQLPAPPFFPRAGKASGGVKRSASSTKTPHDTDTDDRPAA